MGKIKKLIQRTRSTEKKVRTKVQKKNVVKYLDTNLSLDERKKEYEKHLGRLMNPLPPDEFDPNTFDPQRNHGAYEIGKRVRRNPPQRLPTKGLKPKEILDGQMIGMFESKQDLYLLIAHVNNTLLNRIEELENRVAELEQKPLKNIK